MTPDAQVEESLLEAGKNRAVVEAFLGHYQRAGDLRRVAASRWLVANMKGKGFVPFTLRDAKREAIPFDALSFKDFAAAQKALDQIEQERGPVDFVAEERVLDLQVLTSEYLVAQTEGAFEAWDASPPSRRLTFDAFLNWILPYRSSEEPATAWCEIVAARVKDLVKDLPRDADSKILYERIRADVGQRVRFDERYYLHPTDQSFTEAEASKCGRCEDMTNMVVYAARALGLAVATDYTPYWGHRDNNHAWPVLLDREGKGSSSEGKGAVKVYRRTFAIQPDALPAKLPKGREPPNRYLANPCQVDVTEQYARTVAIFVSVSPETLKTETTAYLCVYNAGEWQPIAWAPIESGPHARFLNVGSESLVMAALHHGWVRPLPDVPITSANGAMYLPGTGRPASLEIAHSGPGVSLVPGEAYVLEQWSGTAWDPKGEGLAGQASLRFSGLTSGSLYRLSRKTNSDKLERLFSIEDDKPRWW